MEDQPKKEHRHEMMDELGLEDDTTVAAPVWKTNSNFSHLYDEEDEWAYGHEYPHGTAGFVDMDLEKAMERGYPPCINCMRVLINKRNQPDTEVNSGP